MIRHFARMDIRRLKANKFSDIKGADFVFDDDAVMKHTLVDNNDRVLAVICFQEYWRRNFYAFFLISEEIGAHGISELKDFVYQAISDLGADRVQTHSVDAPEVNRWHEYLGFTCEGKHEKMLYDKDYRSWAVVRGRNY